MIHVLDQMAESWGANLWRASWQGAIAVAVAWAIARWCTFLSPRVVCWVWRLACLKLLVALFWGQPVDLAFLPAEVKAIPAPKATPHVIPKLEPDVVGLDPDNIPQPQFEPEPPRVSVAASSILLPLWLIGVAYCISRTARQWHSIRQLLRSQESCVTDRLLRMCQEEGRRLGVLRFPRLHLSSQVESPLLVGVWRPSIILPDQRNQTFDEAELRLMLAHELTHLRRHDLAWNWLPTVATWLFFFNPLVWLMVRRWSEAQEAACDEVLIQQRVAQPADYGRLLLKLSALSSLDARPGLTAAGVLGAYRNLERRILTMARVKPFSARRLAIAACLLSLTGIIALIPWRLVAYEVKSEQQLAAGAGSEQEAPSTVTGTTFAVDPAGKGAQKAEADPAAQRALKRLKELGATPAGLKQIGIQGGWKGKDADLSLVNDLPDLNWLYLDLEQHVGVEGFAKVQPKRPIRNMILDAVSDEILAKLDRLPRCSMLHLPRYKLSDDGFRRLGQLAQGIERLELVGPYFPSNWISDKGLQHIGQILSLKGLQIHKGDVTDEGLAHLVGLNKFEDLNLSACHNVRGSGFAHLAAIKSLRQLSAFDMQIDADGLNALAKITQLASLRLQPIKKLSTEDVGRLRTALPGVMVSISPYEMGITGVFVVDGDVDDKRAPAQDDKARTINSDVLVNEAAMWTAKKEYDRAKAHYEEALRVGPASGKLSNTVSCNLAWLLATCPDDKVRDGRRAVELATRACEGFGWKGQGASEAIDTLAAAHAEAGDFDAATKWQMEAIKLAAGNAKFQKAAEERLALYRQKKPYRETVADVEPSQDKKAGIDPGIKTRVDKSKTVQYVETRTNRVPGGRKVQGVIRKVQVLGSHQMREELTHTPGDQPERSDSDQYVQITDAKTGILLTLDPAMKTYQYVKGILGINADGAVVESKPEPQPQVDFYGRIRQVPFETAAKLTDKFIDGKVAAGFEVVEKIERAQGTDTWTRRYWIDPETKLPVRIEVSYRSTLPNSAESDWVRSDIVFDQQLDETLFSTDPPNGYRDGGAKKTDAE